MCRYDVDVVSPAGEVKTINMYSKHQPVQQATVGQLKKKALKAFDSGLLGDVRLIVQGKPLEDESASLSDAEIKPKTVVQMVTKVNGVGAPVLRQSCLPEMIRLGRARLANITQIQEKKRAVRGLIPQLLAHRANVFI